MKTEKRPNCFFFTPRFKPGDNPMEMSSGCDFVASYDASDQEIKDFLDSKNLLSFERFFKDNVCRIFHFNQRSVRLPLKDYFKKAVLRIVVPFLKNLIQLDSWREFRDNCWIECVREQTLGSFAWIFLFSKPPDIAMKEDTPKILKKVTNGKTLKITRFIIRADKDLISQATHAAQKGGKIALYSSNLDCLCKWTSEELLWMKEELSWPMITKKTIKRLGIDHDPIYVYRASDKETRPHILGNLLTMYANLSDMEYKIKKGDVNLDRGNLQFYIYNIDGAGYRGNFLFDEYNNLCQGTYLLLMKKMPGRMANVATLPKNKKPKNKEFRSCFQEDFDKKVEKRSTRLESLGMVDNLKIECKERIEEIIEDENIRKIIPNSSISIENLFKKAEEEGNEFLPTLIQEIRDIKMKLWNEGCDLPDC